MPQGYSYEVRARTEEHKAGVRGRRRDLAEEGRHEMNIFFAAYGRNRVTRLRDAGRTPAPRCRGRKGEKRGRAGGQGGHLAMPADQRRVEEGKERREMGKGGKEERKGEGGSRVVAHPTGARESDGGTPCPMTSGGEDTPSRRSRDTRPSTSDEVGGRRGIGGMKEEGT
jgi:hypothetical protein